jgi:HlyD family secretion protein
VVTGRAWAARLARRYRAARAILFMSIRRKLVGAAGVVVVVAAGAGLSWPWMAPARRSTAVLRLYGVVEVQEIRLGSKVGGRVAGVLSILPDGRLELTPDGTPAEGQLVEKNAVLVTFEIPELEAQLAQWKARLKSDEAQLDKLRRGPRDEEIKAAQAAVNAAGQRNLRAEHGYRKEEVDQASDDWKSAAADLDLARKDFDRAENLWQRRTIPKSEYDAAHATYERALRRESAAHARFRMMDYGSRDEDKKEAAYLLDQARANLKLLEVGTAFDIAGQEAKVAETRGKIDELEANRAEKEVKAPSRCVIDVISVRKGDLVTPGQMVVRVLKAEDLWVKVFIPETELGKIRLGQSAEVTVDAYPDRRMQGTVAVILTQSEFTPRNIQSIDERRHQVFGAKVRVADPQGVYKSGMAAQVALPVAPATGAR